MLSISKSAEKCSYRSTEKPNMITAKRLIEKGVPASSTRCPNHVSRQLLATASTFSYSPKISPVEHIHALSTCLTRTNTVSHWLNHSLYLSLSLSLTHTHTHTHTTTHTQQHYKSVNMFGWGIFGAVWKGRCGGQELCVEMIRAPSWGSWYPPFRSVLLL